MLQGHLVVKSGVLGKNGSIIMLVNPLLDLLLVRNDSTLDRPRRRFSTGLMEYLV